MQVVLTQDVKSLGKKGELVNVAEGYARNFLFPRKLAAPANAQALGELKAPESAAKHKIEVETAEAKQAAALLEGQTVKLIAKAGAQGRLFGSVTSKEVAEHRYTQREYKDGELDHLYADVMSMDVETHIKKQGV